MAEYPGVDFSSFPFPLGFNILHDISSGAIFHHLSAGVILSQERQEGENGLSYPLEGGDSSAQGPAPGPSSTGGQHLARAEGNLLFLGTQCADRREKKPSNCSSDGSFHRLCMHVGFSRGAMKRHLFSLQAAQFFLSSEG